MTLITEQINLDVIKKRDNIWLKSYTSNTILKTVTPILADKLNRKYTINLIPVVNTHIAGTKYFPLKFKQYKQIFYLHENDWIAFTKDNDNKYDPNAVICRSPITVLNSKFIFKDKPTKLILNSEIHHTQHVLMYGGKDTQLYLPIGYVPQKHSELIRNCIDHYNKIYCPDAYINATDQILAQLTGNYNNVVGRIKSVTYTGNHCNYYITIYVAQSARLKYLNEMKRMPN